MALPRTSTDIKPFLLLRSSASSLHTALSLSLCGTKNCPSPDNAVLCAGTKTSIPNPHGVLALAWTVTQPPDPVADDKKRTHKKLYVQASARSQSMTDACPARELGADEKPAAFVSFSHATPSSRVPKTAAVHAMCRSERRTKTPSLAASWKPIWCRARLYENVRHSTGDKNIRFEECMSGTSSPTPVYTTPLPAASSLRYKISTI
jgi:hypothetical protein